MAIADEIPGLDVTIEMDGAALPEHDYRSDQDEGLQSSSTKYVEAPSGAEFSIRYLFRPPFTPPSDVLMDILFDNKYVQVPFFEHGNKDGCEGYLISKSTMKIDGRDFTQKFRFSELQTEDTNLPLTPELRQRLSSMGRIVLYFYFIENLEAARPAEVVEPAADDLGVLSEKALQKGASTPGDVLTHQASLAAPEHHDTISYNHVRTLTNEPFATFTFYYRSTAALKSLGVIPRAPTASPEPEIEEEPKDPEQMTAEEMREKLRRMRDKQREAIRVKREREESENIVVGDDEPIWMESRLTKRRMMEVTQKMRCKPGPGDEVVSLDD